LCETEYPGPWVCAHPEVGISTLGSFIATWEQSSFEGDYGIRGARYQADGQELIYKTQGIIAEYPGPQINPDMARHLVFSNHIVVWQDDSNENGFYEVKARGLSLSSQSPHFDTVTVNSDYHGQQLNPSVAFHTTVSSMGP
jgi:hypothetical protein